MMTSIMSRARRQCHRSKTGLTEPEACVWSRCGLSRCGSAAAPEQQRPVDVAGTCYCDVTALATTELFDVTAADVVLKIWGIRLALYANIMQCSTRPVSVVTTVSHIDDGWDRRVTCRTRIATRRCRRRRCTVIRQTTPRSF